MAKMDDLEYGPVMITRGKHKGTIGFYDDTNGRSALVFLGAPFISPCAWISVGFTPGPADQPYG